MNATDKNHAIENGYGWLDSICEKVAALQTARNADDYEAIENTEQDIFDSVLSVEVRTNWHAVGAEDSKPTEYMILLTTGGPALRIIGELDEYGQPNNARLEWQDWGTPWTRLDGPGVDKKLRHVLTFAQAFYYGE